MAVHKATAEVFSPFFPYHESAALGIGAREVDPALTYEVRNTQDERNLMFDNRWKF